MSSSISNSRQALLGTLCGLAFVVVAIELVLQLLAHPADLVDSRIALARSLEGETRSLLLGDSVANQIAPPPAGNRVRSWAQRFGLVGPLPDHRGAQAPELDRRYVFLTGTAGVTAWGHALLYRTARDAGARPKSVHLVMGWGGWSAGRDNPFFEDAFVARFTHPGQIAETVRFGNDASLGGRMAVFGALPSARLRGPLGQRVLALMVPRSATTCADGGKCPETEKLAPEKIVSEWNRQALAWLVEETRKDGVRLHIHLGPFADGDASSEWPTWWREWQARMPSAPHVTLPSEPPPRWPAAQFRDGVHVTSDRVPALARWYAAELGARQ